MAPRTEPLNWSHEACRVIGQVLLSASSRTLTAPEIANATGRANVKRTADEMVDAGLLEHRPPPQAVGRKPGRRATVAYHLPHAGAGDLRAELEHRHPVGQVQAGQQIVLAEVGPAQVASLFETLDASPILASASWFALLDSEPQELAIVFSGPDAAAGALDLMAELRGAQLQARRAALTDAGPVQQLIVRTRHAARAAHRARIARATREAV